MCTGTTTKADATKWDTGRLVARLLPPRPAAAVGTRTVAGITFSTRSRQAARVRTGAAPAALRRVPEATSAALLMEQARISGGLA